MEKGTNDPTGTIANPVEQPNNGIASGPINGGQQDGIGSNQGGPGRSPERVANDPERIGGPEAKKRRGRPALTEEQKAANARARAATGTGADKEENESRKTTRQLGLEVGLLAQQVQGLHAIAAAMTGQPIFQLKDDEAKALAKAVADLATHYQLDFAGPIALWVNLAATLGMIYMPRFMMIQQMNAMAKAAQQAKANAPGSDMVLKPQGPIDYTNANAA